MSVAASLSAKSLRVIFKSNMVVVVFVIWFKEAVVAGFFCVSEKDTPELSLYCHGMEIQLQGLHKEAVLKDQEKLM